MTEQTRDEFNAAKTLGQILAQIPSYQTIKDSGSDGDSGLVNSEIVVSSPVDLNRAHETVVAVEAPPLENTEMVVFDELSALMASDHLFRQVVWEWKMLPATLYGHLSRLDHDRVREEIRQVSRKPGLRSKGAYLRTRLGNLK